MPCFSDMKYNVTIHSHILQNNNNLNRLIDFCVHISNYSSIIFGTAFSYTEYDEKRRLICNALYLFLSLFFLRKLFAIMIFENSKMS